MININLITMMVICALSAFCGSAAQKTTFQLQLEDHWFKQLVGGQSGRTAMPVEMDAFGAVNGNRYETNTGFHTIEQDNAWWQVDLEKNVPVGRIVVCNRSSCEGRIRDMEILLSVDGQSWKKVYACEGKIFYGGKPGTEPLEVRLSGEQARYVRMQIPKGFLHLNEVEVYAKGDDKVNIALKHHASQSTASAWSTKSLDKVPPEWLTKEKERDPVVSRKNIEDAIALMERTLEYVQKVKLLPQYVSKFNNYRQLWNDGKVAASSYNDFYITLRTLRRDAILSHPDLNFEKILINRNPPTKYSHNGDQHLGIHSRVGPGLTILTNWKSEPVTTAILAGKLPEGAVRNPDLHYDGKKVAFAFCDHSTGDRKRYFLYEAAIDGSWVRQLTGTKRDPFKTWHDRATVVIEDNDPCYLPDDRLVFVSTRSQSYGRCHGGRYNPAWVLHTCDKNGDNIHQLSYGNENEYEPSVLNDGRIVFTRWEYTNRHEMLFHMLWWCRPDGTSITHYFGNDMLHPMMMVETTAIPGTHKVVTTAQGHHSYNTGTTVVLDVNNGENSEESIEHITDETPYSETKGWPSPHYSHPCPVNEDMFLVSRANHTVHHQGLVPPPADRAIYLVDNLGGRELIYEDPSVASVSPIIVRTRKRPPVIPSTLPSNPPEYATVYVQNAYLTGNDPEGKIKPGMIKAIRVNALGVQPRAHRTACSKGCPNEIPKRVVGTVPVDENGFAFFKVPPRTALQMQILDKDGMAILTEKSFFYMQPGEQRSCVGCHANPDTAPIPQKMGYKKPDELTPPSGPQYAGGLSFMRTVQPVLDRYCIRCHGLGENSKADKINLIHDGRIGYPRSYLEIVARGDHRVGDKGYMWHEFNISRPYRFYAHRNKVSHMIKKNHGNVNMDDDSYMRVIEWLDLNAQCYGDLFPNKLEERRIDAKAMKELRTYAAKYLGEKFVSCEDRALINVGQPEESRILMAPLAVSAGGWEQTEKIWKSTDDPEYRKLKELAAACVIHNPNENTNGWDPSFEQGGGEDWVRKEREKYISKVKGSIAGNKVAGH